MCAKGMDVHLSGDVRRPVQLRPPLGVVDLQSLPPAGWCPRCGGEIFCPTDRLCFRCSAET